MKSYASKELIESVKHIKDFLGVRDFQLLTTYVNAYGAEITEIVTRKTANGISSYANRMFSKHGESTKVSIYYFYKCEPILLTTYSA